MTKDEAIVLVEQVVNDNGLSEQECIVQSGSTIEKWWGWVFFYQSKKFLESNDFRDMLVGNAPIIVNKASGEYHLTGTAYDISYYIEKYEDKLQHGI